VTGTFWMKLKRSATKWRALSNASAARLIASKSGPSASARAGSCSARSHPTSKRGSELECASGRATALGTAAVDSTPASRLGGGAYAPPLRPLNPPPFPHPPAPSARRPEPSVFDPALPEALTTQNLLPRLAHALEENARHEAERIPGLERISGHVLFISRQRVVGNSGGVVSEQLGELNCEVELDGRHGEQVRLIHLADSFLPFALMGAPRLAHHATHCRRGTRRCRPQIRRRHPPPQGVGGPVAPRPGPAHGRARGGSASPLSRG
jgi:hypothetical protein